MADTFSIIGKWVCLNYRSRYKLTLDVIYILSLYFVQKVVSALNIGNQIYRLSTIIIKRLVLRAVRGVKTYVRVCLYPGILNSGEKL